MKIFKHNGFTLVEILIVVIIIGILITMAVPSYMHSIERSKCAAGMHTLTSMRNAALDYFRENETFSTMDIPLLEQQVGVSFANTNNWQFDIPAATDSTFTIRATRDGGPHDLLLLTVDQLDQWGGNYPSPPTGNDPGDF